MRKPITTAHRVYDFTVDMLAVSTGMIALVVPVYVSLMGWASLSRHIQWSWALFAIMLLLSVNTEVKWRRREEKFKNWLARRANA